MATIDLTDPITVWIDQARQPAIDAYIKAHLGTENLIKTVIVDREQLPARVLLEGEGRAVTWSGPMASLPDSRACRPFQVDLIHRVARQTPGTSVLAAGR